MLNKKKNNKGFTLVELLVVIAIIGILAVVAVPSLIKNINKANASDVVSYASAVRTQALSMYADGSYTTDKAANAVTINDMIDDIPDSVKTITGDTETVNTTVDIAATGQIDITIKVDNDDIAKYAQDQIGTDVDAGANTTTITIPGPSPPETDKTTN